MRKRTDYILRLKPWSPRVFLAALLAIALAATMQGVFLSFGAKPYFAAFFPAIPVASLPAGIFAAVLAIPIVWWHSCRRTSSSIC